MKELHTHLSILELCGLFGHTRFAWYRRKAREEARVDHSEAILDMVRVIRKSQPKVGTPKLYRMLKPTFEALGIKMGRNKLNDLIQSSGMGVKQRKRRYIRTTDSNHRFRRYPHLVRDFEPDAPHQLWVVDITFIPLPRDKYCFLTLITDNYSHMIVGWHLSRTMLAEDCIVALEMAIEGLPDEYHLIHHSDRGSQFASEAYTSILKANEIRISMTENGDPKENAVAERVNGILKRELLLGDTHRSYKAAYNATRKVIRVYNYERLHSSCDYLPPAQAHKTTGKLKKHWKNYRKEKAIRRLEEERKARKQQETDSEA